MIMSEISKPVEHSDLLLEVLLSLLLCSVGMVVEFLHGKEIFGSDLTYMSARACSLIRVRLTDGRMLWKL